MTLAPSERLDWLQLIRTETIGPVSFHRLLARFGSARIALERLPLLARAAGRAGVIRLADRARCEAELERAEAFGARFVASSDDEYPALLAPLADRPPLLCVRGDASLFERRAVAIIGARNASAIGRKIARLFAEDLGTAGVAVISGLARGIDAAAHEAALHSGTIAVVGGGIDVLYPKENEALTEEIFARGLVVSESAMGWQPTARDFPRRNRLISGLSLGVVIVEAAEKSGTRITARFANEQGREVFVVPGSPLDPRYQGSINLMREGATPVASAAQIIEALDAQTRRVKPAPDSDWRFEEQSEEDLAAVRAKVREALSFTPIHRDEILRAVDAPPGAIIDALLDLVLAGEAAEDGGSFMLTGS